MSNRRQDATGSHGSPYSPMIRRFVIIEEEEVSGRTVNAEMLKWVDSSGYVTTGRKVYVRGLDATDEDPGVPEVGSHVWAIWMYDTAVWEVVNAPSTDLSKRLVRFTLSATMTTSDESKAATIVNQYGPGIDHAETAITVKNMLTHVAGVYLFEGDSGDAGLAMWDSGTTFIIIMMECP
jgi:hypothetical protein